jgi:predicted nucleic acid-binding protein
MVTLLNDDLRRRGAWSTGPHPSARLEPTGPAAHGSRAVLSLDRQQTIIIVDLGLADYERMAELVETYADFPLGTTDAAVVAVAERLQIIDVATLDRRHFSVVRPWHVEAFTLLP